MLIQIGKSKLKIICSVKSEERDGNILNLGWAILTPHTGNTLKSRIKILQFIKTKDRLRVGFSKRKLLLQKTT